MNDKRKRETIAAQWRRYDDFPPLYRRLARAGMIFGMVAVAGVIVMTARLGVWAVVSLWRATSL